MRLIDADELKGKAIADPDDGEHFVYCQDIDEAPTVDAVPVIRCRDCIHRHGDENPMCMLHTEPCANARGYKGEAVCVEMDGFCSYGERRKSNENHT